MRALSLAPIIASLAAAAAGTSVMTPSAHAPKVWPLPASYSAGTGVVWIDPAVEFVFRTPGQPDTTVAHVDQEVLVKRKPPPRDPPPRPAGTPRPPLPAPPTGQEVVEFAVQRTRTLIFNKNIVPWKSFPRGSAFEPAVPDHHHSDSDSEHEHLQNHDELKRTPVSAATSSQKMITQVLLHQLQSDPEDLHRSLEADESYTVSVTLEGEAKIAANTSIGIARALTTFSQLFFSHSCGNSTSDRGSASVSASSARSRLGPHAHNLLPSRHHVYTPLAPVAIVDKPLYPHRGFNLDVARSYFSLSHIKRTIDALAFTKANRFHLHIIDSQAWPLEVPSIPELSRKGAYHPSMVYTPEDVAEIQRYSALQGVQTYVEIEMPGHTASVAFSFPDLIAAFLIPDWKTYAAQPPTGTLKLNHKPVDEFIQKVLTDVLPRLRPHTSLMHTGGDEVNRNAYSLDPTVNSSDINVIRPYLQAFLTKAHATIRDYGLTPVVWEEMIVEWGLELDKDVIVQTWIDNASVLKVVNAGHRAIAGSYHNWYLDCGQGQWVDFAPESADAFYPFADYCSPRKNWRLAYSYSPRAGIPTDKQHLVIGGEGHLWAEQTDEVNLDKMLWPRLGAIQEALWTGSIDPATGKVRSQVEVSPRFALFRERLVSMGIGSEPVYMPWCSMEGGCVW